MKPSTVAILLLGAAAVFLAVVLYRRSQQAAPAPKQPATAAWEALGSIGAKALDVWG